MVDLGTTNVLVADDEPSTRAMVARHLRSIGYKVIEAVDGDEAISLALEHLPDVVVLDVRMPGMSVWEVWRRIRETVSLAHTGVVMLTGIGESLNEITSPLYGADAHLDKPFEFSVLDATIAETLERRRDHVGRPDGADVEIVQTMTEADEEEDEPSPETPKGARRSGKNGGKRRPGAMSQREFADDEADDLDDSGLDDQDEYGMSDDEDEDYAEPESEAPRKHSNAKASKAARGAVREKTARKPSKNSRMGATAPDSEDASDDGDRAELEATRVSAKKPKQAPKAKSEKPAPAPKGAKAPKTPKPEKPAPAPKGAKAPKASKTIEKALKSGRSDAGPKPTKTKTPKSASQPAKPTKHAAPAAPGKRGKPTKAPKAAKTPVRNKPAMADSARKRAQAAKGAKRTAPSAVGAAKVAGTATRAGLPASGAPKKKSSQQRNANPKAGSGGSKVATTSTNKLSKANPPIQEAAKRLAKKPAKPSVNRKVAASRAKSTAAKETPRRSAGSKKLSKKAKR